MTGAVILTLAGTATLSGCTPVTPKEQVSGNCGGCAKPNLSPQEQKRLDNELIQTIEIWLEGGKHIKRAEELLDAGASVEAKNQEGHTALTLASYRGRDGIAKLLIERGADLNAEGKYGWIPIMWIIGLGDDIETAKILIENGADVDYRDELGQTKLMRVVSSDYIKLAKLLIKEGADVDARNEGGWTPLIYASEKVNVEMAKLLVENGADVNVRDEQERTPLMWAVRWGDNIELTKFLIENGANIHARNKWGDSVLSYSRRLESLSGRESDATKILIEHGAKE